MEDKKVFEGDHFKVTGSTSFSQLLFADDDYGVSLGVDLDYAYTNSSSVFLTEKHPKMLCFGNYSNKHELVEFSTTPQKSGVTCSDSSSASSGNNGCAVKSALPKPNKKRNGSGREARTMNGAPLPRQRTSKKTKADNPTSGGHAKRKENLGERITTLQQLVSPFGKTDTASVLHEAMGYIRFLHDQVQVLCSPYLQRLPSLAGGGVKVKGEMEAEKDLRSRGLCLVPADCTLHVANSNGADFWSPAVRNNINNN